VGGGGGRGAVDGARRRWAIEEVIEVALAEREELTPERRREEAGLVDLDEAAARRPDQVGVAVSAAEVVVGVVVRDLVAAGAGLRPSGRSALKRSGNGSDFTVTGCIRR